MATDALLAKIISQAVSNTEYEALQQYLKLAKATPKIQTEDLSYLGEDVSGIYRQVSPNGKFEKSISLDKFTSARNVPAATGTLIHELTHAADVALDTQVRTTDNKQLIDAYSKLALDLSSPYKPASKQREQLAAKLNHKSEVDTYRTSNDELAAFGVGNSSGKPSTQPGSAHLDSTMATEFMLLLDLALRDLKSKGVQQ